MRWFASRSKHYTMACTTWLWMRANSNQGGEDFVPHFLFFFYFLISYPKNLVETNYCFTFVPKVAFSCHNEGDGYLNKIKNN